MRDIGGSMSLLRLSEIKGKILVIGSVFDKIDIINQHADCFKNYQYVIINGNISYPFDNLENVNKRIQKINELSSNVIYNLGSYDYKLLNILIEKNSHKEIQKWILSKSNVIRAQFQNQSSIIILNGGVSCKSFSKLDLEDNLEISFISKINGKPWQNYYAGQIGYIISNNPLTTDYPIYYPYSLQLGNKYSENMNIYAQEVNEYGLLKTILL